MNIILFTKSHDRPITFRLGQPRFVISFLIFTIVVCSALIYTGFELGKSAQSPMLRPQLLHSWQQTLDQYKHELSATKSTAQAHIDSLSLRLGQLQAHVVRVDALGQRLTEMASLGKGEFDFSLQPAQGGPENAAELQQQEKLDFIAAMDALEEQLDDRRQQLSVLETMLLHSNLQKRVFPAGRPIKQGWISSYFGMRTDPFTGKRAHHGGIDFAAKMGTEIVAVAAGVVTWSGKRIGYGNMVEIDHGNGYITRYGHNKENLARVGDTLEKGQIIAYMGSSGRSTGPHVHFEVLRNGKVVDPMQYIRAANEE